MYLWQYTTQVESESKSGLPQELRLNFIQSIGKFHYIIDYKVYTKWY